MREAESSVWHCHAVRAVVGLVYLDASALIASFGVPSKMSLLVVNMKSKLA